MFSRLRVVACVLFLFAARLSAGDTGNVSKEIIRHEFPFNRDSSHVKVPVEIGGRRKRFVIDTGANIAVFDESLKPFLGSPLREVAAYVSTEGKTVKIFRAPQANWGPLQLNRDAEVTVLDFSRVNRVLRNDIGGIIGMPDLKTLRVQFDLDAAKLRILSQLGPDPGSPITIRIQKNAPFIKCRIGRMPSTEFLIDTGARITSLQMEIFDTLLSDGRIQSAGRIVGANLNGELTFADAGRLRDFSMGDLEFQNLFVMRSEENRIGLQFLSRFITTFDFPNNVMYLKKGMRFSEPDITGIQGFGVFFVIGDKLMVVCVDDDGPADKAGLKVKDVIDRIDGKDFNNKSLYQINCSLEKPGQNLKLRVRRGEETRDITIAIPKEPPGMGGRRGKEVSDGLRRVKGEE